MEKKSYLPCSHKGSNWLCEANKFSKQELCKNTRTAIHANFLRSALLKEKDIGARKNKTKQIFCYNSKKQGGFDYFKTKTDSLAIVKEINFFYPKFTRPLFRKIASDWEGLISPD